MKHWIDPGFMIQLMEHSDVLNTLLEFIEEGAARWYGFTDPISTIHWWTGYPEVKSVS
tara:strand:- start:1006 stop:1179 length:174 start_codon:yes stop_codon:yes gene_type:complete